MRTNHHGVTVGAADANWLATHLRTMMMTHPVAWANSNMTLPQLTALHFIKAKSPVTLAGLAESLGTGSPATCAMVDRLARAGLVHRVSDPKDHRCIRLTITPTAESMIGKIDLETARHLQMVISSMSPSARRCLTDVLQDTARRLANQAN